MAIPHILPGEVVDISLLGAGLAIARTTAPFKSTDLEVMRLVLRGRGGETLPAHRIPGEITMPPAGG